jgi:long-chain acyl-CoA synthetase
MHTEPAIQDGVISPEQAVTLDGLLRERVKATPDAVAYRHYNNQHANWRDYSWSHIDHQVGRWQTALTRDGLQPGDCVAVMLRNSPEWVIYDQAALGLGLVIVPLYTQDLPENVAYIIAETQCKVLLLGTELQWQALAPVRGELASLSRVLIVDMQSVDYADSRVTGIERWLPHDGGATRHVTSDPSTLATIVYTSGTTGRPKGVMLSHRNILSNVAASCAVVPIGASDILLSFLPLSHTFERTCGYYLTLLTGSTTAYARSVQQLSEDLAVIRPTKLISVPRIYERVHAAIRAKLDEGPPLRRWLFSLAVKVGYARFEHAQGREPWRAGFLLWPLLKRLVAAKILARLGGRLRVTFAGGAALAPDLSRVFIGLGLPVIQGYGLTETSPVACANRIDDNVPASVGKPIPGVELKLGEHDALMIRGPNVMLGYWHNEAATRAVIDEQGWLNSGDTARIDEQGHVFITGRLKEIIVMSTGEKIPPFDVEAAIQGDPLFEQVMVIGEGRPFLSAMAVLDREQWRKFAASIECRPDAASLRSAPVVNALLARIAAQTRTFPGYAQVRKVAATLEPWTVENGMLTPTMKLRRRRVLEKFHAELDEIYRGH